MRIEGNHTLITDLYELTMAAAYFENKIQSDAVFELFVRDLPPDRGYLILAGLDTALDYLLNLKFSPDEIAYLRGLEQFKNVSDSFFDYLSNFQFTCDVWAAPEGTVFFPGEPVMRVRGPVIEAQIVETYLVAAITFESMIATKASRVVQAARGRPVADFGSRRAHGPEAAVRAARASFIGGCGSTSNVYAGYKLGVPVSGTAAHSWTMAHKTESEAFRNYAKVFPENTILLIDTYDTVQGAKNAAKIGKIVRGVRIDSGDLVAMSKQVRRILDDAGNTDAKIFASGDLDEHEIERLLNAGAPLDAFGVGTRMVTSSDAPYLSCVYKLVEMINQNGSVPCAKLSEHKATYPGTKQVWRKTDAEGFFIGDVISFEDETVENAAPLLNNVIRKGKVAADSEDLTKIRDRARKQIQCLKEPIQRLKNPARYPVLWTDKMERSLAKFKDEIALRKASQES